MLPRFDLIAPGRSWAELGGDWSRAQGWEVYGEVGHRWRSWDLAGRAWWQPDAAAAGVAAVARW